jgi:hypothetical protein
VNSQRLRIEQLDGSKDRAGAEAAPGRWNGSEGFKRFGVREPVVTGEKSLHSCRTRSHLTDDDDRRRHRCLGRLRRFSQKPRRCNSRSQQVNDLAVCHRPAKGTKVCFVTQRRNQPVESLSPASVTAECRSIPLPKGSTFQRSGIDHWLGQNASLPGRGKIAVGALNVR